MDEMKEAVAVRDLTVTARSVSHVYNGVVTSGYGSRTQEEMRPSQRSGRFGGMRLTRIRITTVAPKYV